MTLTSRLCSVEYESGVRPLCGRRLLCGGACRQWLIEIGPRPFDGIHGFQENVPERLEESRGRTVVGLFCLGC